MKKRLMFPVVFVALVGVACGGDGDRASAQAKNYETVQEGSAAGVTSSIQGPGESLPPVTSTNADTTTAFSLDPNVASTTPAPVSPNSVAGAAPPAMTAPILPPPQTSAASRPVYTPPPAQPAPVTRRPEPAPAPAPAPPTETAPPTDTAPEPAPPAQTDTVAPEPEQPQETEPAEEEPPPPPTTTDTRGQ